MPETRYGIAELFGQAVVCLQPDQLRRLAAASHRQTRCPFNPSAPHCQKQGGVCSLILYERGAPGQVSVRGSPVSLCPKRFLEEEKVFRWVGEKLLGTSRPMVVAEVPFLERRATEGQAVKQAGRIDHVLVRRAAGHLQWCALEMQAVYFSGEKMQLELEVLRGWSGPSLPFPKVRRRPDFRSSAHKRLMPQLQTKVPTLRRWGKKTAVVVDRLFWEALAPIRVVDDLSSADIAWFVVRFDGPDQGQYRLQLDRVIYTTLENAVEGLTGATPVSLEQFERAIQRKIERLEASSGPCR